MAQSKKPAPQPKKFDWKKPVNPILSYCLLGGVALVAIILTLVCSH